MWNPESKSLETARLPLTTNPKLAAPMKGEPVVGEYFEHVPADTADMDPSFVGPTLDKGV